MAATAAGYSPSATAAKCTLSSSKAVAGGDNGSCCFREEGEEVEGPKIQVRGERLPDYTHFMHYGIQGTIQGSTIGRKGVAATVAASCSQSWIPWVHIWVNRGVHGKIASSM